MCYSKKSSLDTCGIYLAMAPMFLAGNHTFHKFGHVDTRHPIYIYICMNKSFSVFRNEYLGRRIYD